MKNLWNDEDAKSCDSELALRVYSSRLLGQEPELVMHGGGNTSVKIEEKNILGEMQHWLYVKGSGWDLATIEEGGFSPVELIHLQKLATLPSLSDPEMVNQLKTHMSIASAPTPSVEAILHAILPFKYVDHTHADALITVTNTPRGREFIQQIYGDEVVVIPYCMPGFDLARLCAIEFEKQANEKTIGMVLMNHGLFSFGPDAKSSYLRMIDLVNRAEEFIQSQGAWQLPVLPTMDRKLNRLELATFRKALSQHLQHAVILDSRSSDLGNYFARHPEVARLSQQGPLTPDHVIRTKRIPMLGRDICAYAKDYENYFQRESTKLADQKHMLDTLARVILDKELGSLYIGKSASEAQIVRDIYEHTMQVILRSEQLEKYQALSAEDIFAVEYWDLEQAKLNNKSTPPVFAGEVVLITGGASGIGQACVQQFLQAGAAVASLDIDPHIEEKSHPAYFGLHCDITQDAQLQAALDKVVERFGGLDMLVLNAGIFPAGHAIADLPLADWHRVLDINLNANLQIMQCCFPLLKNAANYGRMVIVGSKNVPAPGPGAAAYSASKAALNQLARIASMEWGAEGIRVNSIHPDAVFDTAIWTQEVLQARAAFYNMSVEEYKTKNILKVEISSIDIANLVKSMCSPLFHKITGAQLCVDGGNQRTL